MIFICYFENIIMETDHQLGPNIHIKTCVMSLPSLNFLDIVFQQRFKNNLD